MIVYFVTHPEVHVQPDVPVPQWGLSSQGRLRLGRLLTQPWVAPGTFVASSDERKAVETAAAVAVVAGTMVVRAAELGENDRSATGFLPPAEFELVADEFFGHPDRSVRGWETANDAQSRIARAVEPIVVAATGQQSRTAIIVSHGGVGTLLQCALRGVPIDRCHDQPGQGSYFAFDGSTRRLHHGWRRI